VSVNGQDTWGCSAADLLQRMAKAAANHGALTVDSSASATIQLTVASGNQQGRSPTTYFVAS
jgi:hypothetical protein